MYIAERVINIADLERHISSAYTMSQLVVKELSRPAPDMKSIKEMTEAVNEELEFANNFEFCIEQRKVTSEGGEKCG